MNNYDVYEKEVDHYVYLLFHMLLMFSQYELPAKIDLMLDVFIDIISEELNIDDEIPANADILNQKLKIVTVYNN